MKLDQTEFKDTVLGAELEQKFEIDGDSPVIFEILRDKMYSDKIAAVCREVSSNCRDANREAGNADIPIEIEIVKPNKYLSVSDMSICFKDNGPGITPDRMSNIYLRYAASTKRDSNEQTGGFGLGAKTPFAYSDTFTVITVCDVPELNKRVRYEYTAMIDSTRKGKMVLFDSEETDEECGTRVIVPIADQDKTRFERECIKATYFWEVLPKFIEFSTDRPQINVRPIEKTDGALLSGSLDILGAFHGDCIVAIDGIPYPIQLSKLDNLSTSSNISLLVRVSTGQVTISANREQVQYDDVTKTILTQKLEELIQKVNDSILQVLTEQVQQQPTLLSAQNLINVITHDGYIDQTSKHYDLVSLHNTLKKSIEFRTLCIDWNGEPLKRKPYIQLSYHKIVLAVFSHIDEKWNYVEKGSRLDLYGNTAQIFETSPNGEVERNVKNYILNIKKTSRRNISAWDENHPEKKVLLIQPTIVTVDEQKYKDDANYRAIYDKQLLELDTIAKWFPIEGMYSDLELRDSDGTVKDPNNIPYYKRTEIEVRVKQWRGDIDCSSNTITYNKTDKELKLDPSKTYFAFRTEKLTEYAWGFNERGYQESKGKARFHSDMIKVILNETTKEADDCVFIVVADKQWPYFENHPSVVMAEELYEKCVAQQTAKALLFRQQYIDFCICDTVQSYMTNSLEVNLSLTSKLPQLNKLMSQKQIRNRHINNFESLLREPQNADMKKQVNQEIDSLKDVLLKQIEQLKKDCAFVFFLIESSRYQNTPMRQLIEKEALLWLQNRKAMMPFSTPMRQRTVLSKRTRNTKRTSRL